MSSSDDELEDQDRIPDELRVLLERIAAALEGILDAKRHARRVRERRKLNPKKRKDSE